MQTLPPTFTETSPNMLNRASRVSSLTAAIGAVHPRSVRIPALAAAVALAGCLAVLPGAARADSVPSSCDKVASPAGSDSAAGTEAAPLRSAQALMQALAPGQVGCLRTGSYGGGLRPSHGGRAGAPLILRSYPGEQAQVTGRIYIPRGSDYITLADLHLDGNYQTGPALPGVSVAANHTTFEADDVTNDHTEICFVIGSAQYGIADSTVIVNSRIHDCGVLPSSNMDHGIYIEDATNTYITGNLIDHNVDRGIQFYPSAQGSVVTNNVIADNGEGIDFGGDGGVASNGNTVEHNLIVNSNIRGDVESWYPPGNPVGVGNIVQNNCVSSRGINTHSGGFSARSNVTASSGELVAGVAGYVPAAGSACASIAPALPRGIVIEGTRSGGAPTPTGKEAGAGTTPPPTSKAPGTSGHEAPGAGGHEASHAGGRTHGGKARGERRPHHRRGHRHHRRHSAPSAHSKHASHR
jgi:parallel beta-helix repeat protein